MMTLLALPGCSFVSGQLHDKAMEEKLLRPGALDPGIPKSPYYVRHTFKLVNRYQVTHEWPGIAGSCQYGGYFGKPPDLPIRLLDSNGDIYERDGHTFLKEDSRYTGKNYKDELMDRYVRPEYTVIDVDGKPRTAKGFEPVCFQSWDATHHAFTIYLVRSTADEWKSRLASLHPSFNEVAVGLNKWQVGNYRETGAKGRQVETWVLPIMETGYLFSFRFAHDAVSQQNPARHTQMEEIFRHLIESVKIAPIQP